VRRTYFQRRAADVLFGSEELGEIVRWNRTWPPEGQSFEGCRIVSSEVVRLPDFARGECRPAEQSAYLAVLHVFLPLDAPVEALSGLVRLGGSTEADQPRDGRFAPWLPEGYRPDSEAQRAMQLTLLAFPGEPTAPAEAPQGWPPRTSWLWAAAAATPYSAFPPDVEDPDLLRGMVHLSASWRALVLRDGAAFLALRPDTGPTARFLDAGEVYVRTIYTDALLLATMQRIELNRFADRLADLGDRFEKSAELRDLVNAVTEFRNVLWWEDVTRHGVGNESLSRAQQQHRTPQLLERVTADLAFFHQQVDTQAAERTAEASAREETRGRRFDRFASIAAITFGLPVVGLAAMTVPTRGVNVDGHAYPWWLVFVVIVALAGGGWLAGLVAARGFRRRPGMSSPPNGQHPDSEKGSAST
jgi:hypothetical protein